MNVQEILNKHTCNGMRELTEELAMAAMREACEATVDMCVKAYYEPNVLSDGIEIIYIPTPTKIRKVKNKIV